jgi:hypothetical protein
MAKLIYPVKLYIKNAPIAGMFVISLLLKIASWVWLLWQIGPQKDYIFLHYNILFGVDLIGPWQKILILPGIGLLVLVANTVLAWMLFNKNKFAAQILHAASVVCQVLLFIGSTILVFLNV